MWRLLGNSQLYRRHVTHLRSPVGGLALETEERRLFFSTKKGAPPDEKPLSNRGAKTRRDPSNRKQNFADMLLRSVEGGSHSPTVPRTAARKNKSHLYPVERKAGQGRNRRQNLLEDAVNIEGSDTVLRRSQVRNALDEANDDHGKDGGGMFHAENDQEMLAYFAEDLIDDDKYFWREEEFDVLDGDLGEFAPKEDDEESFFEIEYDAKDLYRGNVDLSKIHSNEDVDGLLEDMKFDGIDEGEGEDELSEGTGGGYKAITRENPENSFFFGQNDILEIAALDANNRGTRGPKRSPGFEVAPLRETGPNLDDFLEAMLEHPTKYAQISRTNNHPDSHREPKPLYPRNRAMPPLEYVEKYNRFLYVSGLPPLEVNGEPGDLSKPLHRDMLQKLIAQIASVDSQRVFCATTSSGFVGYNSPRELANALVEGPSLSYVDSTPSISTNFLTDDAPEFAKESPESIVLIENMPPGNSSWSLARDLFPQNTPVGEVFGGLSPDDIHFLSQRSVLVRLASPEVAQKALESVLISTRLEELGRYPVQFLRARRELVHAGYDGPNRTVERRVVGPRLIVDGDMPSKQFYVQHAGAIQLNQVDTQLSHKEISRAFDPYSELRRDVQGSVEIVRCEFGNPTGTVYVGFDFPGEAEACMEACHGRIRIGGRKVTMRLLQDRVSPGQKRVQLERRPARQPAELLDDLNSWERYVSPEDIKILEDGGVAREYLAEALRGIRFNNVAFGSMDSSLRSEALDPSLGPGERYKELVQTYVRILKECIATPDDVGELYESLFMEGEEIDLSIFEREKIRQKQLLERRSQY